jgi:hypothetical protein
MPYAPICAICKEPVALAESKTDEHGHAVHENCYIWTVELRKPRKRITQIDAQPRPSGLRASIAQRMLL